MRRLRALWMRVHGLQRTRRQEEDFAAELESHVSMHTEDGIRAGLSPDEARRQALIRLGGAEQTRQAYRDRRTLPPVESVMQDVRFASRQLRRSPGFAITAILTLALGIGANEIIFTLVDSILLRPLPYARQDRLVRLTGTTSPAFPKGWIRELGAHSSALTSIAAYGPNAESNLSESDVPERVFGAKVTVNTFDVLGIRPVLGEFFSTQDAVAGRDHEVVLSYAYWRQHFAGAPSVLGRTIRIDGVSRSIVGVMPAGVHFPYADTQFAVPVSFAADDPLEPWQQFDLHAFGRMADGIAPAQAQAEVRRLHKILLPLFPWRMPDVWASDMTVVPLLESQTGTIRPRLLLLFGATGLILLIACANVANLTLARAKGREREIAIRSALGASNRRLLQQLLSESVVLGLAAGVVGLGATLASLRLFVLLLPADTPRIENVSLHAEDLLFVLGASILAGILLGLIPAMKTASFDLMAMLRIGSRGLTGSRSHSGLSTTLVMAQIGLSVVVITAAGLVLHSLYKLTRVDPGFHTAHTITAEVSLDASACKSKGRCQAFYETLIERTQGVAGLEGAALADALPFSGRTNNYVYDAEGHPREAHQGALLATGRTVSPRYFELLGLRLLRGRLLTAQDASGSSHAAVVSEQLAQRLWPHQNPIGKHLLDVNDESSPTVWNPGRASEVVGVVSNTRDGSLGSGYADEVYLPMTAGRETPIMYLLAVTQTTPAEVASTLRHAAGGIDSLASVSRLRTMDEVTADSVAAPRGLAVLLLTFGGLAVMIGAVGVYSLIAYTVNWRTREIGLRLALGAQRWQIVLNLVRQSLLLALGGCFAGLLTAAALGHLLQSFLFEVGALDPVTFGVVAALMVVVALLATWIPARRAAFVDPMQALRME
jgi:predicted permease